jgi:hypothetical protein
MLEMSLPLGSVKEECQVLEWAFTSPDIMH